MKTVAATAGAAALLIGTPLAVLYLGDRGTGTRGGSTVGSAFGVAPSHSSRAIVAGLLRDASLISIPSLKFLVDASCRGGIDAHVFAASNADRLIGMYDELKTKLYGKGAARCAGKLIAELQPEGLTDHYENRVDRIAALRDRQRLRVASVLGSNADADEAAAAVVVVDLDVAFLPTVSDVLSNAEEMVSSSHRVRTRMDVLCSAGVDVHGGYYDTYATVLLPDTFVYPLQARKDPEPREEEDASLIVNNGGFSYKDLLRWFVDVADKQDPSSPSVPVRSCFGGLAIYRAERWLDFSCSYSSGPTEGGAMSAPSAALSKYVNKFDERPCEHVVLHECLRSVDPLTSIAVLPDMRPVWHGGSELGAAISTEKTLKEIKSGDDWEKVDRKLRDLQTLVLISHADSENGKCEHVSDAFSDSSCCWNNTTKIWMVEKSVNDGSSNSTAGHRTYNLCPNTTYPIGRYNDAAMTYEGGMAAIEIMNPDMTIKCGHKYDGNGTAIAGGDCVLLGGQIHFRIKAKDAPLWDNVTVKGIHSVDASGANILGEGMCVGRKACGSEVKFEDVTFKNNHNDAIALIGGTDEREASVNPVLDVRFDSCSFESNHMPLVRTGSHYLVTNSISTSVSFAHCSFTDNRVESPPDSFGSVRAIPETTASLIKSYGRLAMMKNCFVNNAVGTAVAVAEGAYHSSNGYYGNEHLDAGACVDGVLAPDDECHSSSEIVGQDLLNQKCAAEYNPGGNPCGPNSCSGDEFVCCNPSCGICTVEGGACIELFCTPDEPTPDEPIIPPPPPTAAGLPPAGGDSQLHRYLRCCVPRR